MPHRTDEVGATGAGLGIMWRPQIGELVKQITVGTYFVARHLPVYEDSQEGIRGIVGECPAIGWEGRRVLRLSPRRYCPFVIRLGTQFKK